MLNSVPPAAAARPRPGSSQGHRDPSASPLVTGTEHVGLPEPEQQRGHGQRRDRQHQAAAEPLQHPEAGARTRRLRGGRPRTARLRHSPTSRAPHRRLVRCSHEPSRADPRRPGGAANIVEIEACITRLRTHAATRPWSTRRGCAGAGAHGLMRAGSVVQVVVGPGRRHDRERDRGPAPVSHLGCTLILLAPSPAPAARCSEMPDPVFAAGLVGPALAISPCPGEQAAVAPIAGVLAQGLPARLPRGQRRRARRAGPPRHRHRPPERRRLHGAGPEAEHVAAGQDIVRWDPGFVAGTGRSPICAVVVLDCPGPRTPASPGRW